MKLDERQPLTDSFLRRELMQDFRETRHALLVLAVVTLPLLAFLFAGFYWLVIGLSLHIAGRIVFGVIIGFLIVYPIVLVAESIRDLWKFYRKIRDGAFSVAEDTVKEITRDEMEEEEFHWTHLFTVFRPRKRYTVHNYFYFDNNGRITVPDKMLDRHAIGDRFFLLLGDDGKILHIYSVQAYKRA